MRKIDRTASSTSEYIAVIVSAMLIVAWMPHLFIIMALFSEPGMEYVRAADIYASIGSFYPMVIGVLVYVILFVNDERNRALATKVLWLAIILIPGSLVYYGIAISNADLQSADRFDSQDESGLIAAISANDRDAIEKYINARGSLAFSGRRGINPLYVAVKTRNWPVLDMMLLAGLDPNYPPSGGFEYYGPAVLLAMMVSAADGDSQEFAYWLDRLVASGLNLNNIIHGDSLLHSSVRMNAPDAVKALLDRGARVDIHDRTGMSPLEQAVAFGCWECAETLLQHAGLDQCKGVFSRYFNQANVLSSRPESPQRNAFLHNLRQRISEMQHNQ